MQRQLVSVGWDSPVSQPVSSQVSFQSRPLFRAWTTGAGRTLQYPPLAVVIKTPANAVDRQAHAATTGLVHPLWPTGGGGSQSLLGRKVIQTAKCPRGCKDFCHRSVLLRTPELSSRNTQPVVGNWGERKCDLRENRMGVLLGLRVDWPGRLPTARKRKAFPAQ